MPSPASFVSTDPAASVRRALRPSERDRRSGPESGPSRTKTMKHLILALAPLAVACAANEARSPAMNTLEKPTRTLSIELLALDLRSCGRCTGTDRNLEEALASVASLLRESGTEVRVEKHVVSSAEEARRLRLVSSPTIRVDGRDIAPELRESTCKDCGELCACEGGVDCRVWVWKGEEHLQAPKQMIVEAVLRAWAAPLPDPSAKAAEPYEMPENLRAFFAGVANERADGAAASECCDRSACCEPEEKDACCGSAPAGGACGCEQAAGAEGSCER